MNGMWVLPAGWDWQACGVETSDVQWMVAQLGVITRMGHRGSDRRYE